MRHRKVEGVGINDADYPVGQGRCPYYQTWLSVLQRCYSPRTLARNPTYVGCSVAPEWHLFSTFRAWMEQQAWSDKVLDKDLRVPGNKQYGPDTCVFVTQKVNTLLNTQPRQRGALPLGVTRHGDRFKVNFKKDRKTRHIGVFDSIAEAAKAYGNEKADWISQHAINETCPITQGALYRAAESYRGINP